MSLQKVHLNRHLLLYGRAEQGVVEQHTLQVLCVYLNLGGGAGEMMTLKDQVVLNQASYLFLNTNTTAQASLYPVP